MEKIFFGYVIVFLVATALTYRFLQSWGLSRSETIGLALIFNVVIFGVTSIGHKNIRQ